ncbi:MAG: glycerol-3-phosphate 1-O-acyltransferase PlsY [Longimicrobiaceae bacterium]
MTPWLWLVASYLLGSIPSSYLAGRWTRGIDLREHGSGNLGATNTFRVLGARAAVPVMLFDVFKGFAPVWFFSLWDGSTEWTWALAYGAAAIVGHIFSIYMRFRGGKGVATAAGVFLALAPTAVGVAALVWAGAVALFRMVSLASLAAAVTLILMLLAVERRTPVLVLGVAVGAFVIFAHRANIGRILRGEEHRFGGARDPEGAAAAGEGRAP